MTEKQVGFLYKAATLLAPVVNNNAHAQLLKSYYLMRCKEITKGYGLPRQQFSTKSRCSFCCLEWTRQTETKVIFNKNSRRQRKRIRQKHKKYHKDILHYKKVDQICSFCKHHNEITVPKPSIEMRKSMTLDHIKVSEKCSINNLNKIENEKSTQNTNGKGKLNLYSNAREVFSLSNEKNTVTKTIPIKPKIIKNNKKKKDKFAGLCKQAVLAAAKLKEKKEEPKCKQECTKYDKLSLFLRPSGT